MSKFCELAGKVTNCTDDCKRCLEEETKTRDIEVGDKVRYLDGRKEQPRQTGAGS